MIYSVLKFHKNDNSLVLFVIFYFSIFFQVYLQASFFKPLCLQPFLPLMQKGSTAVFIFVYYKIKAGEDESAE